MVALAEPGVIKILKRGPSGDLTVLYSGIRTEEIGSSDATIRPRLDVLASAIAQSIDRTPMTGRPVKGLPFHTIPENGSIIVQMKPDAADTLDSDDTATYRISVIERDLTLKGTPLEFRSRVLTFADRDTSVVADDAALVTTEFRGIIAWTCPTGIEWMIHGDARIDPYDDTA